jgi:hypothetical protein
VLTSAGGGTSRYSAGTKATFDVVSGHRDAGNTSCPGATTYARMGEIRQAVPPSSARLRRPGRHRRTRARAGHPRAGHRQRPHLGRWTGPREVRTRAATSCAPERHERAPGSRFAAWDLTDPAAAGTPGTTCCG